MFKRHRRQKIRPAEQGQKPLDQFQPGARIKIECVRCGLGFQRRLCELGLFDGAEVEIVKNDRFGPLIIKILNSKIALGRHQARRIYGQKI